MRGILSGLACFFGMHDWSYADQFYGQDKDWFIWRCDNCGKCELE